VNGRGAIPAARRQFDHDVIVAGGGPAGSATAFFLARRGLRVAVLDRAVFPRDKPCADYLSPQASRLLNAMGVEDAVQDAGAARLNGMVVRAPNGVELRGDFIASHGYQGFRDCGVAIRRTLLDLILLRAAKDAGASVIEEARVTGLLRNPAGAVEGVRAVRRGETGFELRAPLVVGADGLNSSVAHLAGLARRPGRPRRVAIVSHYRNVRGVCGHGEMHVGRGGYLGISPVNDGEVNVALVVDKAEAGSIHGDLAGFLDRWITAQPHLAQRFTGATMCGPPLAVGPFARRARQPYAPGVALTGDAAEFLDPFTGEGIYTALRGGEMLADHAAAYCASEHGDEHLVAYAAARRREFASKFLIERAIAIAVGFPPLMNRAARVLSRRKDMADLLVGVTGDFVPAREVLRPGYLIGLLLP
jgi:geranylgeranyl reductase family protein